MSLATGRFPLLKQAFHRCSNLTLKPASNWFWNMVLAFAVPPLLWNISYKMVSSTPNVLAGMRGPVNRPTNQQYYLFGAFNAAAFIHMALAAPETKGYTLEEMDEVFDSGLPAWKTRQKPSRLEQLEREIEAGNIKVAAPLGGEKSA